MKKLNYCSRKLEENFLWIVLIILLIPLIIISAAITFNNSIVNTPPLSNVIYVTFGSLLSAIVTIIWNESFFKRTQKKEKQKELKMKKELKEKTFGETLSILSSVGSTGIHNLELIENRELYLHFLQTGFWELTISNIAYKERNSKEFILLDEINSTVNQVNRIIADRQVFILENREDGLIEELDKALITLINALNERIRDYMIYVKENVMPISLKDEKV